jgi:ribosomal protein L29
MKAFQEKDAKELRALLGEKSEALRSFRFGMKGSRTRDTRLGANLRKDIARIQTLLKIQSGIKKEVA